MIMKNYIYFCAVLIINLVNLIYNYLTICK